MISVEVFKKENSGYLPIGQNKLEEYRASGAHIGLELALFHWIIEVENREGDEDLVFILMGIIASFQPEFETTIELPKVDINQLVEFLNFLKNEPEYRGDVNIISVLRVLTLYVS